MAFHDMGSSWHRRWLSCAGFLVGFDAVLTEVRRVRLVLVAWNLGRDEKEVIMNT
jgi:hypothetical protein